MLNGRMDGYWIGGYLRPDQFLDHMTVSVRQANKIHKIVKSLIRDCWINVENNSFC